jgi:hypothetical protein
MSEWLAAAECVYVVPSPRRRWRRDQAPAVVPESTIHAVKETVAATACGQPRPDRVVGIWPMGESANHCLECAALVADRAIRTG